VSEATVVDKPSPTDPPLTDAFSMRVSLSDTDAARVVYMTAPADWANRGWENLLRAAGLPYEEILPRDLHYPVVSVTVQHSAPLILGTAVTVRTGIVRVGRRSVEVLSTVTDDVAGVLASTIRRVAVAKSRTGQAVEAEPLFHQLLCSEASLAMPEPKGARP
jgi:YbgC/YbaW family acyl-CoA thioester hydrolase